MKITSFVIAESKQHLTIELSTRVNYQLPFEYLRISSPEINTGKAKSAPISNKKQVKLIALECVAKHGYRLLFDDQHNAIYSEDYLIRLAKEHEQRWQDYLEQLAQHGHSREAMIEIKQVN